MRLLPATVLLGFCSCWGVASCFGFSEIFSRRHSTTRLPPGRPFQVQSTTRLSLSSWHQASSGGDGGSGRFSTPEPRKPSSFDSPVLRQVYPALVAFKQRFGHVNIPLGSTDGRKCETLRRLQVQGKLSDADVAALDALRFRWHSLEDVYRTVNFSDLYTRLLRYGIDNGGNLSVPKKYAPDPELGAWVTGVRRVGRDDVDARHVEMLDEIGFEWESPRKCGSSFMKRYREIRQLKDDGIDILDDDKVQGWVRAQQEAAKRGALSETRMHYMEQLLPGWMEWETAEPVAE